MNITKHLFKKYNALMALVIIVPSLFVLPGISMAANVLLSNKPLASAQKSDVLPNLMFVLDNSGSMGFNFTPDYVCTNSQNTSTQYTIDNTNKTWKCPLDYSNDNELIKNRFLNAGYNAQYYNPNIYYEPPVDYTGASFPNQVNFNAVKRDGFSGITGINTGTDNLIGNAEYYAFIPGEFCTKPDLKDCVASPTKVVGSNEFPAPIRWCNSLAEATSVTPTLGACQVNRVSGFTDIRVPTHVATVTVGSGGSTSVNSIEVDGNEIMRSSTNGSSNSNTVAQRVVDRINECSTHARNNCDVGGYRATRSGSVVSIFDSNGGFTTAPTIVISKSGGKSVSVTSNFVERVPGSLRHTNIASTTNSYTSPGFTTKNSARSDCAGTTCTYAEEMTNYANWYAYYRMRMQGMKTAASLAFKSIGDRYRVGYTTINEPTQTNNKLAIDMFNDGAGNQKANWYNKLFHAQPEHGGTPLRDSLSRVGRIYAGKFKSTYGDPVEYACQPNFTLLTTDGYWNGATGKDITGADIKDIDGSAVKPYQDVYGIHNTLADVAKYYYDTDLRQSPIPFDNCTGALGTDVCGDPAEVATLTQNMTTLTLGLGIDGNLQYESDYKTSKTGDYYELRAGGTKNWGQPGGGKSEPNIDDLWHAAVNANGTYFSAKDPKQLTSSLQKALSDIQSKVGTGTGASASTLQPVAGNNENLVPSYRTVQWSGNIEARKIGLTDLTTSKTASWCVESVPADNCASGSIEPDTSAAGTGKFFCVTKGSNATSCAAKGGVLGGGSGTDCQVAITNSCTGAMSRKNLVSASSDNRNIYINNGGLVSFTYNNLPTWLQPFFESSHLSTNLSQWSLLTDDSTDPTTGTTISGQKTNATQQNLVQFLRGSYGFEDRSSNSLENRVFRYREATLGDITDSQPAFLNEQNFEYTDAGYNSFISTAQPAGQNNRPARVYVGANDGMFHVFDATHGADSSDAGTNKGKELFAFIPTPVIPNLYKLADQDYATQHINYVNGDPVIGDVYKASTGWKRILVTALAGGGRGYFALDVTDANNTKLLWEYTSADNSNLGYTYGNPVITKMPNGQWVVLVTSGYNNGRYDNSGVTENSPKGDGKGYLIALDPLTGNVIKTFPTGDGDDITPSGLAQIAAYTPNLRKNNETQYVYGGDLNGNLWRFDISQPNNTAALKFATLKGPSGQAQPITVTPQLGVIDKKRVVFVGTGKYLEQSDITNPSTQPIQSLYAIMDKDTTTSLGNPRSSLVTQTMTQSGTDRVISSPNNVNLSGSLGWVVDLPAGERQNIDGLLTNGVIFMPTLLPQVTDCSPGGIGYNNFFDYKTGGSVLTSGVVSNQVNAPIVGLNLLYDKDGNPIVGVTTADNPTPQFTKDSDAAKGGGALRTNILDKNPDGTYGKRKMWRELTRP